MIDRDTLNLSDAETKRKLYAAIAPLTGLHEVAIKPVRATRRQCANRYYWGVVIKTWKDWLANQGQVCASETLHDMLKLKFIPADVTDPRTGEVIGTVPGRSKTLSIQEFADYIDRCTEYLRDMFGIVVPDPTLYGIERKP